MPARIPLLPLPLLLLLAVSGPARALTYFLGDGAAQGASITDLGGPDTANAGNMSYLFTTAAYTNSGGSAVQLDVTRAHFWADNAGSLRPFVALYNGGALGAAGSYTIVARGDPIAAVPGQPNSASFAVGGDNPSVTVGPGQTLVAGFHQTAGVVPFADGGTADFLQTGSILPAALPGPPTAGANWNSLLRTYAFSIAVEEPEDPQPPSAIALSNGDLLPGTPVGTLVGIMTTTDPNPGDNIFTYTLAAGAGDGDNGRFAIAGERLETAAALGGVGSSYSLRVRSTDPGGLWREEVFTVVVVAGQAPTAMALSPGVVDSRAPAGSAVGRLTTTDPDRADSHTYALVAGPGGEDNAAFVVIGNELRLAGAPSAAGASLSVRLRSTDLGGQSIEAAFTVLVIDPAVRINEFMAANSTGLLDEDGEASDWIEILNAQSQPVDLGGWFLTDDAGDLAKWRFPERVVPGGGYLLVFASGKDRRLDSDPELHANFRLSAGGEFLALVKPDGVTVASLFAPAFPPQTSDISYGVGADGSNSGFMATPTPGGENDTPSASGVNSVGFSVPRGFYSAPFNLVLTPAIPGSAIRYTTNGTKPSPTAGTIYAAPIAVSRTTTLRAIAYTPDGGGPTPVIATHTYVFAADVAAQAVMTTAITNNPTWGPRMVDSLLALPTVSLVQTGGLSTTETETSMELFFPDGTPGFQIDCGVEHFGGHSLGSPKKNMRMTFKRAYGKPRLNFDLFGSGAAKDFDSVILRTGSHDTWFWTHPSGHGGIFIRGRWAFDRQLEAGNVAPRGRWVHVYLNGTYHGMHHLMERPDAAFMASYHGGEKEDYEALNAGSPIDGDKSTWNAMKGVLGDYGRLREFMDVRNYADYMLLQFYGGNDWDWNESQNWATASRKMPDASYKFFAWDSDVILRTTLDANVVNRGGPENLWATVRRHEAFRRLLADRAQKFFFNGGMLTRDRVLAQFDELAARVELPIIAETARWGGGSYTPATWRGEIDEVKNDLINQRTGVVVAQMRNAGVFPNFDAPLFSQRGGAVPAGFALALSLAANAAGGQIYYTLDGSDPAGDTDPPVGIETVFLDQGAAARALIPSVANGGSALGIAWKGGAEPFTDSAWLAGSSGLGYDTAPDYDPFIGLDLQAMENQNASAFARIAFTLTQGQLDAIDGLRLDMKAEDGFIAYLNGVEVASLLKPASPNWNSTATGFTGDALALQFQPHDLGAHVGALRVGTNILAFHILNQTTGSSDLLCLPRLVGIDYPDGGPATSGLLYSAPVALAESGLVRARVRLGGQWSALDEAFFYVDAVPPVPGELALTEIHFHPHGSDNTEFVELRTLGVRNLILDGLRFADGIGFTFPPGTVLAPGRHVVVAADPAAFASRYSDPGSPWRAPGLKLAGAYTGSLGNEGENLVLLDAQGNPLLAFAFGDGGAWPGRADGAGSSAELADPASAPTTQPALDAYLADGARWRASGEFHGSPGREGSGPDNRVVINEVLARPVAPASARIELSNRSGAPVDAGGWFVSDGADGEYRKFALAPGTTLAVGGFLTLDDGDFNAGGNLIDFALDPERGGDLYLLEADASRALLRFVDRVAYDAAAPGESSGRWPDGTGSLYPLTGPTFGAPNNGGDTTVRVGPVVVSEIMYNPAVDPDAGLEFIEVHNAGSATVDLAHWRLRGEADYDFGAGNLAPGSVLVLVGFDPSTDLAARDAFLAAYPTASAPVLRGPWSAGSASLLDNGGATVRLLRPGALVTPVEAAAFYPALFEDAVDYDDAPPWPTTPDGTGPSLARVRGDVYGDDPGNWTAAAATPGSHATGVTTFEDWATSNALGSGPKAERLGDFDDDGTRNLLEFALASDPAAADPESLPHAAIRPVEVLAETSDFLTLTYRRRRDAPTLTYRVEVSGNAVDWSPATATVGPPVDNGDGTDSITVRDTQPVGEAPPRFMRLSVSG
ncbi:MAG: lamin tail domain-containing protein [Verrucomicrobiales bacterium]